MTCWEERVSLREIPSMFLKYNWVKMILIAIESAVNQVWISIIGVILFSLSGNNWYTEKTNQIKFLIISFINQSLRVKLTHRD